MLDKKIILIGYSGHGFVVADTALENQLNLVEYAEYSIVQNNPFQLSYAGNESDNDFLTKKSRKITACYSPIELKWNKAKKCVFNQKWIKIAGKMK